MRKREVPSDDPTVQHGPTSGTPHPVMDERRHVVAEYIRSLREFLKAIRDKLN